MQKITGPLKNNSFIVLIAIMCWAVAGCHTIKKVANIHTAIYKKDTATLMIVSQAERDSIKMVQQTMANLLSKRIDFTTFSGKIKVEYEDSHGKQPNTTAYVRIIKDSLIWVSLYATVFNIEAFRILITKDSVIVLDRINKEAQVRSFDYLEDVAGIPLDFKAMQDIIIGNPVFLDSNIVSYKKAGDRILMSTIGKYFKHLLTLTNDSSLLLLHSKLDDVDVNRNRTADLTYDDYENKNGINFSTFREITFSEKNKLDITLFYKQYDFNKDLSISFSIPKNYTLK
jgi:uncharacterized protein DUF4292